jgi:DNA replication and repair protein RecF
VRIVDLHVTNVRNLADVHLQPDPTFNVITGPNGHGKTNLVESIHLLSTLRSFRSLRSRDLLRDGTTEAAVQAETVRHDVDRSLEVVVRPHGKRASVNGSPVRDLHLYFGSLNTVVFTPEDTGVLRAGPSERRLFLDRMIFNARPRYAAESHEYEAVLRHRNATLKEDRPDLTLLDVYDEQLSRLGGAILRARLDWIKDIRPLFLTTFGQIFGAHHPVDVEHTCSWSESVDATCNADELASLLLTQLRTSRRKDVARGFTQSGPHRDDWTGRIDDEPVRIRGSQGQQRAFVLALKIAEIQHLHALFGDHPILLLDDVSSELDPIRNARLFEFLTEFEGQVFLTTTDLQYVPLQSGYRHWTVHHGIVHAG